MLIDKIKSLYKKLTIAIPTFNRYTDLRITLNFFLSEIAELKKGASLGEMALLDNETRSADAIAKEDSVLLKINQDVFYELMESNADIMKQIIKLLTSRIRKANIKLETNLK